MTALNRGLIHAIALSSVFWGAVIYAVVWL